MCFLNDNKEIIKWLKPIFDSKSVNKIKKKSMCTQCVLIIKSNKTQSKMRYSVGTDICFGLLYFFTLANVSTGKHSTKLFVFFGRLPSSTLYF